MSGPATFRESRPAAAAPENADNALPVDLEALLEPESPLDPPLASASDFTIFTPLSRTPLSQFPVPGSPKEVLSPSATFQNIRTGAIVDTPIEEGGAGDVVETIDIVSAVDEVDTGNSNGRAGESKWVAAPYYASNGSNGAGPEARFSQAQQQQQQRQQQQTQQQQQLQQQQTQQQQTQQQQPQQQQPQQQQTQQQPPPPTDSLSLAQLRRLASEFPRNEPVAYDYVYEDMGAFDEEIDEWFSNQILQWMRLSHAAQHFENRWQRWQHGGAGGLVDSEGTAQPWDEADNAVHEAFVTAALCSISGGNGSNGNSDSRDSSISNRPEAIGDSRDNSISNRPEAIGAILYIVLGRWVETAGGPAVEGGAGASAEAGGGTGTGTEAEAKRGPGARTVARTRQLEAIKAGVALTTRAGGIPVLWAALQTAFEPFWGTEEDPLQLAPGVLEDAKDELGNLMTIVYVLLQAALSESADPAPPSAPSLAATRAGLMALRAPALPDFLLRVAARLRWDDPPVIPQCQVFLLLWKALLLVFGGQQALQETKRATAESTLEADKERNLIMASPLDYHAFRQEITSKYPAYVPPQPPIPLADDNTATLLPPVAHAAALRTNTSSGANGILPPPPGAAPHGGASILDQPVHIATPAPSPPPSPAAGGKGGKKQNYQTNQNFPFMYPPLDASSNGAGGKGAAALQDALVGRRWEGSDVPSSILEAGELFSARTRMTRATRQLWDERERFLQFERGWGSGGGSGGGGRGDDDDDDGDDGGLDDDDDILDELDLSELTLEEREELGLGKKGKDKKSQGREIKDKAMGEGEEAAVDYGPRKSQLDETIQQRLEALEDFYREALPHLQSLVIVLLKVVLVNVAVLIAQPPMQHPAAARSNGAGPELSADELDAARTREISAKAVSGILLLLLKWLKVSHVLKFEYLTQLLLDCNYVPMLLKLWLLQDPQQLVDAKTDRVESSFFYFCNIRAADKGDESEDEAAPPAIKRRRSPERPGEDGVKTAKQGRANGSKGGAEASADADGDVGRDGEGDAALITDFNRRNFFSLINLLRVMQKICKHKAHRNLLLVHYKSSAILRKMLKVPQPELRLYTLKLFKNQVPYCGRKWRQTNMHVITAVYLYCRPELRDEWLAGCDVDADVENSVPLEQALRSLTHWFNVRRYPHKMAPEVRFALREEHDFFVRELDRSGINWADLGGGGGGDDESVMSWGSGY